MNTLLKRYNYTTIYTALLLLLLLLIMLSAATGAVHLSLQEIVQIILNKTGFSNYTEISNVHEAVFWQLRLPRTFMCIAVGASLAVSGSLLQALFRNPIVEPGLIGTSSGAAFGAAFLLVMGSLPLLRFLQPLGDLLMPLSACVGGLVATLMVCKMAASFSRVNIAIMILAGIAVNAIFNGATGFLAYIARDPQARSITFWSLGTVSGAPWKTVLICGSTAMAGVLLALRFTRALNAMQLGDTEAGYLGINVNRLKMQLILLTTMLVAVATSLVGIIAFIGLVVPHMLRLIKGSDNRFLVIGSALLGPILLLLADMLARVLIAPAEMPIGIITAFTGAPVFMWLLYKSRTNPQKGGFYA